MGTNPRGLDPKALEKATEAYWDAQGGTMGGISAAIRAYLAAAPTIPQPLPPEPPPGFVRVRAAVAVGTKEGGGTGWCASGVHGQTDAENTGDASENWWGGNYRISFITADAPLPSQPAEIVASVETGDGE